MNTEPDLTPIETTPIRRFGITEVSRPMGAACVGRSLKAFDRLIERHALAASGRVHQRVSIAELEAAVGKTITVADWLAAYARSHRHVRPA